MGFGPRGTEGKIAAVRYAREERVPFFGICFGMQMAVIEFARHVCGLEGRQLERGRRRHAASGDRPDDHAEGAHPEGRHDAPRRLPVRARRGLARAPRSTARSKISERHRHRYEFNNSLPRAARGARDAALGALARRHAGRDRRDRRPPVVRRAASSTPSSSRGRWSAIRCSAASSARRCSTRRVSTRRCRSAACAPRGDDGGAAGRRRAGNGADGRRRSVTFGGGATARADRGAVRDREPRLGAAPRRAPARHRAPRHGMPYVFKASFDKANRTSRAAFRGPGMDGGPRDPRRGATRGRRAGPDRRARARRRSPRWRRSSTSCRRRPSSAVRPTSSPPSRAAGKPVNIKKGQFLVALGDGARGREGDAPPATIASWSPSAAPASATTISSPTCARWRSWRASATR